MSNASLCKLGERNPAWKGDKVTNRSLHQWIRENYPQPEICQICNKKTNILDLANMTGIYDRDISNWKYLCKSCHSIYDGKINNIPINIHTQRQRDTKGRFI